MNILFVNRKYHNTVGGVERMSTVLMNEMCRRGHDIHLLSWDAEDGTSFYQLDDRVQWHKLAEGNSDYKATLATKLKRARKIRKIVKNIKPDVAIGFQDGAFRSIKIYTLGMGIPVIAAERNAPSRFDYIKAGKHKNLIFQTFRLAAKITIQCESYKNEYPNYLHHKIVTIPNPVPQANRFADPAGMEQSTKYLLSVGRLCFQKNYPVLLEAFHKLHKQFPDWKLLIAGDGEDRKQLETYLSGHQLQDCISLVGETSEIEHYYCKSHLFCLPSRWEGFPNALAEALSHGLPVVGFTGCAGTRDLIEDGVTGLLAEGNNNAESLAAVLEKLMADDDLREKMGKAAIESMEPYAPPVIFDKWEALFAEVSRK